MSLYTKDSIERVKDTVDMVELVGARTDLRRVGSRYTGLCPFHEERTPSFSVNAEHKLYYCFGCGAQGDAIRFVQETEGLDFRQAIEALSERTGVELKLEREDPAAERRRERRERLLRLVERAAAYYARYLWESQEARLAREYLERRGLEEPVLRQFRVGYAPSAWDRVTTAAQRDGFTREEIAAAGLGQRARGGTGFYDRFRARITFPLADARGRVLGFGARAVRDEQQPKYLNTSENELYHKGRQLFGIDHARGPAAKSERLVVVEGYTDVLALHQAGLGETVAIMGTALTPEQVTELARPVGKAGTILLALDADPSGWEAMLRASRLAAERGVETRVVEMPAGTDPAELVADQGLDAFLGLLEDASSVLEFQVRRVLADADLESPRGRDRALGHVQPLITSASSPATRDHLVRYVADRLELDPKIVTVSLQSPPPVETGVQRAAPRRPTRMLDGASRAERAFLAMCLSQGETGREYLKRVSDEHLSSDSLRLARDHLLGNFSDPLAQLPSDDPVIAATITEVAMLAEEEPSSEPALRLGFLQLELRRIERELRHAGKGSDFEKQRKLWAERENVREAIGHVMGEAS